MNLLEQLRMPLSQARVLTDSLTDAVIYTDRNFAIVYLNAAAEKMFGVRLLEVQGCLVADVIRYELQKQSSEDVFSALRFRNHWSGEALLHQSSGRRLQLKVSMNLVRNHEGRAENILIVCANVTTTNEALELVVSLTRKNEELEAARKDLLQVQQQFDAFMQHSPALTWIVDEQGNHLYANDLCRKTYGIGGKALPSIQEVFAPEMAAAFLKDNRQVILANCATESISATELPSGEKRMYKVYKFPITGTEGQTWVGGIALDITGEVRRQEQLQISNERFSHVIKATSDAIWDWDITAGKVYRGEGFKKLFGADFSFISMEFRNSFVHPDDRERVSRSLQDALAGDATHWKEEYRFLCVNGQYKICVDRASILRNRSGKPVRMIGAMQDVTRQRELEEELRQKELQRRQAISQAVIDAQEKERFEISFELHEQISQTLTTCNLMLEDLSCGDDQERLEFSRKLLRDCIDNIRNISHRINPASLKDVGLKGALENFIHNLVADKKLTVELQTSGFRRLEHIPERLQLAVYRIVQEQLNNIRNHAAATRAAVSLEVKENRFLIEVSDNGKGFDPQQTTQGLGFANIQQRVELYGGEMLVKSKPGEGVLMRISFPFETPKESQAPSLFG